MIEVSATGSRFSVREVWRNNRMKNSFTSSVVHEGFVYGLDKSILACMDAATGELQWKGGRYGYGHVLLASGHLIVLAENGDLALVRATPEQHGGDRAVPGVERQDVEPPGDRRRVPSDQEPRRDGRRTISDDAPTPTPRDGCWSRGVAVDGAAPDRSGTRGAHGGGRGRRGRSTGRDGAGPSGQGLATGSGYPDTWSSTQNVLWKTPVPGNGNSSPIVWGDQVFVTTAYEGGRRVSVLAYRRSDGRLLWETEAPDGRTDRGAHFKNGHASATPSTDGERIYVSFGPRGLFALDFDGTILWQRDLGPIQAYHGAAGSPLLYKDRIILYQDQYRDSFIAAFDTRTGQEIWRTPRDARNGWGTPIAISVAGHDEIIVNSQQHVYAYDPRSRRRVVAMPWHELRGHPDARCRIRHGVLLLGSCGPTLAITPGGERRRVADPRGLEESSRLPFVPSPILYGEQLYMVNDMASIVTSLEATTGEAVWQGRLGVARREGFSASPVRRGRQGVLHQ